MRSELSEFSIVQHFMGTERHFQPEHGFKHGFKYQRMLLFNQNELCKLLK